MIFVGSSASVSGGPCGGRRRNGALATGHALIGSMTGLRPRAEPLPGCDAVPAGPCSTGRALVPRILPVIWIHRSAPARRFQHCGTLFGVNHYGSGDLGGRRDSDRAVGFLAGRLPRRQEASRRLAYSQSSGFEPGRVRRAAPADRSPERACDRRRHRRCGRVPRGRASCPRRERRDRLKKSRGRGRVGDNPAPPASAASTSAVAD